MTDDDKKTLRAGFQTVRAAGELPKLERRITNTIELRAVIEELEKQLLRSANARELLTAAVNLANKWEATIAENRRSDCPTLADLATEIQVHKLFRNAVDELYRRGLLSESSDHDE